MPGGDRTGPMGMGPMTGRAAGYCAGYATPGYVNPGGGGGFFGRGRGGGGRGRRNQYYATGLTGWQRAAQTIPPPPLEPFAPVEAPAPVEAGKPQINILKEQLAHAEAVLRGLKGRLAELEPSAVEKTPE